MVTLKAVTPPLLLVRKVPRVRSIDFLRGLIMIVMALDHTRDYFHAGAFVNDPTDLHQTTPQLFFTRWITHYCAPVFMLLAGSAAFMSGQRKTKKELSLFLVQRGLWLVFLELTVLNFGWFFNFQFPYLSLQVIWALGICMICLAGLIHLPWNAILITGLLLVFGHNLFDSFHVTGKGPAAFGWSLLHERGVFEIGNTTINVSYPLVPWIGVMALGYCLGRVFGNSVAPERRKRILLTLGTTAIVLFFILRYGNGYGDPVPWSLQPTGLYSFLSFLNVTKYPPSLDYLLITLGPAMLFLALTENLFNRFSRIISTYGRVPMLYYLTHIYLIHLVALPAATLSGYSWKNMTFFTRGIHYVPEMKAYGFNLVVVYIVWIAIAVALYPFCKWYDGYKTSHREKWWLSYL